jgi:hypothetical protein
MLPLSRVLVEVMVHMTGTAWNRYCHVDGGLPLSALAFSGHVLLNVLFPAL